MKFLVDNQLPIALAKWLSARGQESVHVVELGLAASKDREIWQYAAANSCVIITKDEDFSLPRFQQGGVRVVWVRLGNCRKSELLMAFDSVFSDMMAALEADTSLIEIR